jgi:hypothetical protein
MTIRLNYVAEKHNLLLKEHFEDRKNIVSKHVLHYIIEVINFVWINKKIATMLLLNVIKVFDNVSYFKLLHNLKKRRIKDIYLIWVKSFFSKRYIIFKLMNHIINRIRIAISVSQEFSMLLIFYVFYNANLINWCINSQTDIIEADFINDINILVMSDTIEKNVLTLKTIHVELCMIWAHQHDSLFVSTKYEFIHFKRFSIWFDSKLILRILEHQISFVFNANISK